MTSLAEPSAIAGPAESGLSVPAQSGREGHFVGVVTRAISWVVDAVAINAVAIGAGLGAQLILSIFPVSGSASSVLKAVAGAAYLVWTIAYFVVFWSWTGQTLGARLMQIRLRSANGGRVKPLRAFVRWIGMNLAMIPLFAGFAPILFGRRGFPDWLARTIVVEQPQLSLADQLAARRARDEAPASSVREVPAARDRPGRDAGGSTAGRRPARS